MLELLYDVLRILITLNNRNMQSHSAGHPTASASIQQQEILLLSKDL